MGVDVDGGMIVGRHMTDIEISEEVLDKFGGDQYDYLLEKCEMDHMSPYFDSDPDEWTVGYKIRSVECWDRHGMEFREWLDELEELSDKFYEDTGVRPHLIGMQHVS